MRARADFYVSAVVRWANSALASAYVRHSGDPERGLILITHQDREAGIRIWVQGSDADGVPCWRPRFQTPQSLPDADAFVARERERDNDLWVIEWEGSPPDLPAVLALCRGEE